MSFLSKTWTDIETFFTKEETAILKALHPLIAAAETAVKANGLPLFEAAAATIATAASTALSGGATKSAAANTAISAVEDAGKALGEDVLHALATAAVTTII